MIAESNRRAVCIVTSMECIDWFCISEFHKLNSRSAHIVHRGLPSSHRFITDIWKKNNKRKVTCAIRVYVNRAIIHFTQSLNLHIVAINLQSQSWESLFWWPQKKDMGKDKDMHEIHICQTDISKTGATAKITQALERNWCLQLI